MAEIERVVRIKETVIIERVVEAKPKPKKEVELLPIKAFAHGK